MPDIALIPTLNEAENIVLLIGQIRRAVPDVHILVVDDDSLDGTASAVRGLEEKSVSLLLRLGGQHDLVIGSRYCGGRRVLNWSWKRLALSVVANWYVKELLRLPFSDCTSGFRCYSRRLVEDVILPLIFHSDGYAFLVEVLFHVHRSQASIAESPIVFTERREGQSKMTNGMIAEAALLPLRLLLRSNKTSDGR
jgi:dolichol-phosphate mannosyltransferase